MVTEADGVLHQSRGVESRAESMHKHEMTSRQRVNTAMAHVEPDRVPADFLATPEVWNAIIKERKVETIELLGDDFIDPTREAILQQLQIDCRVLSYDMFCSPPESVLHAGAMVDWWSSPSRSTPNRMWRQRSPEGLLHDIWGVHLRLVENPFATYEETASYPLGAANTLEELQTHPWPEPDWWDFRPLPGILDQLDTHGDYHVRFRIGSILETAWHLLGLEKFLMDLALEPSIPMYVMDRLAEVCVENTRRVLELAGDRLDMVYFFDDVATQRSLLISKEMWHRCIRRHHASLVELARSFGKQVMYHTDGAVHALIPDLIDLGIDVLSPIQTSAEGMRVEWLKREFGGQIGFHGGIDITYLLPHGTPEEVASRVQSIVEVLGRGGGYILCSSHHIQPDTPIENIEAMYDLRLRYLALGPTE